jgi:pentatricopeptide repeat protein
LERLARIRSKSFTLAFEAFGKVGSADQAEKIWVNIKSTKKISLTEQFNDILSVYCRHGLVDKASAVFKEMRASGCLPNAITYHHLALGCLKLDLVTEALSTMDMGKKQVVTKKVSSSTPWLETTHMLLENFAEIGDLVFMNNLMSPNTVGTLLCIIPSLKLTRRQKFMSRIC